MIGHSKDYEFTVTFRCEDGHTQTLSYGPGFSTDYVHDHAALMVGGHVRSVGRDMPQTGCGVCGKPVTFEVEDLRPKPPPPVDRSQREVRGAELAPGVPDTTDRGDGQQKGYVVLSDAERAKGFVRPVRRSYRHLKCDETTTMGQAIAETYARCPTFYGATFCCHCGDHFPVGAAGEFVWHGTDEKVGT
jgi:hypothetical protein